MENINKFSNFVNIDYNEPFCNRAKIDTGTHCNYNCSFCYYQGKLNEVTKFEAIKNRIDHILECGLTEVDLSGGESSIHKDWFKILQYCSQNNLHISTVSNGSKFKDFDFLQKSKDHGLKEILFSLHGHNEESHNEIVGNKQAFNNIIQAIENAKKLDIVIRINCVVTEKNYKFLSTKYVSLMKQIKPFELNFLTLNLWSEAGEIKTLPYTQSTTHIKKCLDLVQFIPKLNVRYTPFCFMVGYEKYVCNTHQHIYDIYDWNMSVYDHKIKPETYKENPLKSLYEKAERDREHSYHKPKECLNCKYFFICDGLEKTINEDITPISGDRIKDVNYFREDFYEN